MKNRKKFRIVLIMIVVIEVCFCFQLAGYFLAIRQNSENRSDSSQSTLLVHREVFDHMYWLLSLGIMHTAVPRE